MKRTQQNLEYSEKRRGRSLDATGAGPYIKLGLALAALIVIALAVIFVIVPSVRGSIDWDAALVRRTPEPDSSAEATPFVPAILTSRVQSVTLDAEAGEAVISDAAVSDGSLVCAAGPSEETLDRILLLEPASGKKKTVTPALKNDCLRMPRASGDYLVWFDAKSGGGGNICYRKGAGEDTVLLTLDAGLPRLQLDGPYLVFTADAGPAVKLYVIDLDRMEPLTLALLDGEDAASEPHLADGRVYYAFEGGVRVADLISGDVTEVDTGAPAHDPMAAQDGLMWLSGRHGEDTDLYYRPAEGDALILARGVLNAASAAGTAVYGRDGTVYAYSFLNKSFFMLSGAEEYAELVTAGGDYALWRVLSEDGASYRYLKVN